MQNNSLVLEEMFSRLSSHFFLTILAPKNPSISGALG